MEEDLKQTAYQLLGNSVKKKRIDMGITQEQLGEKVGYGDLTRRQAISQIERGAISIPNKRLNDFIEHLKLDDTFYKQVNYLLSIGKYEEAIEMMEGRERKEQEIANAMEQTIVNEEVTTIHHTSYSAPTFEQTHSSEEDHKIVYENQSSISLEEAEYKLLIIKNLLEKGLINEGDYEEKKKEILSKI